MLSTNIYQAEEERVVGERKQRTGSTIRSAVFLIPWCFSGNDINIKLNISSSECVLSSVAALLINHLHLSFKEHYAVILC